MKKFLLLLLTMAVLFGCSSGSGGSDPSDIEPAEQLSAKDVTASGATSAPASVTDTVGLLNSVGSLTTDPVVTELKMLMSIVKSPTPTSIHALTAAKTMPISEGIQEQLQAAQQSFAGLWTNKKASATISASNEAIGNYITLASGSVSVNAAVESTDGGPVILDEDDDPTNLKSVSGDGRLSLAIDSQDLSSASSCIKGFKIRLNAGGEVSAAANADGSDGSASFDYAASLSVAISLADADGLGGVIVLTADAKNSGDIASIESVFKSEDPSSYAALVPSMAVTLAVYDDDGNLAFPKQTYSDVAALLAAIGFGAPVKD